MIGGGQDRKDQKWGRNALQSLYGQDYFDPKALKTMRANSFRAQARPMARRANQRFGLDHGRAWQELLWKYANLEGDQYASDVKENAKLKGRRKDYIAGQFYGAGRG